MSFPVQAPGWFEAFRRTVLRVGRLRATIASTLLLAAVAMLVSHAAVALLGHGSRMLATLVPLACALLLAPVLHAIVFRLVFELEAARREHGVLAISDELTGLFNRRHFMALAEREWARSRRYAMSGALLLVDADHFKLVNDRHGHLAGDALLREIARVAGETLRQPDLLARFGGEELIGLLPHTDPLGALDVAERIRERVAALRVEWQGEWLTTTVSIGVAAVGAGHASLDGWIHDADTALYAAKEAGRNCVRAAPIQPPRRSGETYPVISR